MRRLPYLLLAVLLPFPVPGTPAEQGGTLYERRPAQESYLDEETGVTLPARIGAFRKTEVVRNFNPLIGTVIRYADSDGCSADIYIYSLTGSGRTVSADSARVHFDSIRHAILRLPQKSKQVSEVIPQREAALNVPPNIAGHTAAFRINIAGDFRNSELAVFPFRDKIIKLRISTSPYAPKDGNPAGSFIKAVCSAFNAVK